MHSVTLMTSPCIAGAKGRGIEIMQDAAEIVAFFKGIEEAGAVAWVVQKYINNPLLLPLLPASTTDGAAPAPAPGAKLTGRKFDIRAWVLLTHDYRVFFFNKGVLRTCCEPWTMADLTPAAAGADEEGGAGATAPKFDVYAHLSNHCIQTEHASYGKVDPTSDTNEVSFDDFAKLFDGGECISGQRGERLNTGRASNFTEHILPQMKQITVESLLAAKEQMSVSDSGSFTCAQLFGYDFMIDDAEKVHLIEINSSPASADHLRCGLLSSSSSFSCWGDCCESSGRAVCAFDVWQCNVHYSTSLRCSKCDEGGT
jgi:tubulin--tyrosine ligase